MHASLRIRSGSRFTATSCYSPSSTNSSTSRSPLGVSTDRLKNLTPPRSLIPAMSTPFLPPVKIFSSASNRSLISIRANRVAALCPSGKILTESLVALDSFYCCKRAHTHRTCTQDAAHDLDMRASIKETAASRNSVYCDQDMLLTLLDGGLLGLVVDGHFALMCGHKKGPRQLLIRNL